jgi:hypothetical protein
VLYLIHSRIKSDQSFSGKETIYMNKRENTRHECCVPLMDERSHALSSSRTGVGFVSGRFLPINSKLMVELALSRDDQPVLVQGRVKWVEKIPHTPNFRVGMNFSDISEDSKSRIEEHFKS